LGLLGKVIMITLQGVSKLYHENGLTVTALSEINFEVGDQEFVAVVGFTGCGKTTLLRIVAGLIQPTTGTVYLGNKPIQGPSRRVGLMFQRPVLLPWRTIEQNLSLPGELTGLPMTENAERIAGLLRTVGLERYRHTYPRNISVGMQQIISFCVVLVLNPDVLLMDEPFSALDTLTREYLSVSLLDLWSSYCKTVLFVTHNINEAVFLSDRVIVLSPQPGRVLKSISIPLPRPRSLKLMETSDFINMTIEVRRVLELKAG